MTKEVAQMDEAEADAELDKIYSGEDAPVPKKKQAKKAAKQEEEQEPQEEDIEDDGAADADDAGRESDSEADPDAGTDEEELDPEVAAKEAKKASSLERALQEERRKRQELERQLAQGQPRQNGMMPQPGMYPQQPGQYYPQNPYVMQPQQKPDAEPDKNLDPDAWYEWSIRQVRQENAQLRGMLQPTVQALRFSRAKAELAAYEQDFSTTEPDYGNAKQFYLNAETQRLRAQGYPPHLAIQEAEENAVKIAGTLFQQGQQPAEGFYNYVKQAYGYSPKPVKAPQSLNRQRELKSRANTVVSKGGDGAKSKSYSLEDLTNPDVYKKVGAEKAEAMLIASYKNKP